MSRTGTSCAGTVAAADHAAPDRLPAPGGGGPGGRCRPDPGASGLRLVAAADGDRRRIQRDLHDGIQQDLVAMRVKLDRALEALETDWSRGERMLTEVGRHLDEALESVRALSRGIYPTLLQDKGVSEALRSAARRLPVPVKIRAHELPRCPEHIEVAVYFCCLEALQNVVKHAGPDAESEVRLWRGAQWLGFRVQDNGTGFDPQRVTRGNGLVNMSDRIEAVGGTLMISSGDGRGTAVRGHIPLPADHHRAA